MLKGAEGVNLLLGPRHYRFHFLAFKAKLASLRSAALELFFAALSFAREIFLSCPTPSFWWSSPLREGLMWMPFFPRPKDRMEPSMLLLPEVGH